MSFFNALSFIKHTLTAGVALTVPKTSIIKDVVRFASKKARSSTSNTSTTVRPKHRGWKRQDGHHVTKGTILARQRYLRWLPGLNVGIGADCSLFALYPGRVVVTCEKFDPKWSLRWVQLKYGGREGQTIYKKYFNVIADPQHTNFKLIDQI